MTSTLPDSPIALSLQDIISLPTEAEPLLELLSYDQIESIEQTLLKVKKRKRLKKEAVKHMDSVELKEGIEWISFVCSHNRTVKRYSIRIDIHHVPDLDIMDEKFKNENCIYPRANVQKDQYNGNRWAYETECNILGWKLAWLNQEEIAGKRGLIQRAVDSYRNRYPSMRSRRVARQEKLMNGTLRKRKSRQIEPLPKTIMMDEQGQRIRIKINLDAVALDDISDEFRKANCPFPRAIHAPANGSIRWIEESRCNEIAWKLAWLNPKHLAGRKNLLQRTLDLYRNKFVPDLLPRKHSKRHFPHHDLYQLNFLDGSSYSDSTLCTPSPSPQNDPNDFFDEFMTLNN
ncbi:hypothetical protein RMCBS344292_16431 [Rhizopus microsporus]|nr:hypothetical protein RMCBS344292_16431 [Rhizopus microsporus]